MTIADAPAGYSRRETAGARRLAWAFGLSLLLHLLLGIGWYFDQKYHWLDQLPLPQWVRATKMLTELVRKEQPAAERRADSAPPLMFVEVNPAQAVAEPPAEAQYYSDKSSRAANPEADRDVGVPKITGEQTQVAKTEDVPREKFVPLQPSLPAPAAAEEQPERKARPAQPPGDLSLAKPEVTVHPDQGQAARSRPRTIREALARQESSRIPGQKMKQEGGVSRRLEFAALDAKATPFGAYDAALVEAISQRWYTLLDQRDYASDSRGRVVLQFRLHYDGRITDMNVAENTAGEVLGLICQKAVLDPAPFAQWPGDMRRMMGDTRSIQFTFYYN